MREDWHIHMPVGNTYIIGLTPYLLTPYLVRLGRVEARRVERGREDKDQTGHPSIHTHRSGHNLPLPDERSWNTGAAARKPRFYTW